MDADQIVREFCAAWGRADLDHIMNAFAEDAVYHNIPMAPCQGKADIENFIKEMLNFTRVSELQLDFESFL